LKLSAIALDYDGTVARGDVLGRAGREDLAGAELRRAESAGRSELIRVREWLMAGPLAFCAFDRSFIRSQ
jgi:hypothetical protein